MTDTLAQANDISPAPAPEVCAEAAALLFAKAGLTEDQVAGMLEIRFAAGTPAERAVASEALALVASRGPDLILAARS